MTPNQFANPELADAVEQYASKLSPDYSTAAELFKQHHTESEKDYQRRLQQISPSFPLLEEQAAQDLLRWEQESGRTQNYTAKELAEAKVYMQALNGYRLLHKAELAFLNGAHQSIVAVAIENSKLSEKFREKGKLGKKLAVVETSSRIAPCLTFSGSSDYLQAMIVPYGKEARAVFGEKAVKSLVSSEAVEESARNLQRLFNVEYVLAETSAAPRDEVAKSKRKPEVYICEITGGNEKNMALHTAHEIINTPFREEFNCRVRELMYFALQRMYS